MPARTIFESSNDGFERRGGELFVQPALPIGAVALKAVAIDLSPDNAVATLEELGNAEV